MNFFDVHTHNFSTLPSNAILSLSMKDGTPPANAHFLAVGIHPWYISSEDLSLQLEWLEFMSKDERVIAIGEAGLDFRCDTPRDLQLKAFMHIVSISEKKHLPLIIHCVKAPSDLISIKKTYAPSQPWIMHGFRGKPELAKSLLRHGFYLSFGERFNEETVRQTPLDRLFLETDESNVTIDTIYNKVAAIRGTSILELQAQILNNVRIVFGRIV